MVDAYDAMTNDRSYRRAMSPADAIEELKRCAGTQFDPFIVSEFLQMLKENPPDEQAAGGAVRQSGNGHAAEPGSAGSSVETVCHVHGVPYSRYVLDESMHIVMTGWNFPDSSRPRRTTR